MMHTSSLGAGLQAPLAVETEDVLIKRSIQRSLDQYRLDPGRNDPPRVLTATALQDHRAPMESLLAVARSGMESLFLQVRDAGYVVLLTDAHGVTVDFMKSQVMDKELRHAGLYLGGCWSEEREGTCAVGLAAVERQPVTVHHGEHFRVANTRLTCSAAPILSPDGRLMAVLDASALESPDDRRSQFLVLQMVQATARMVENANFLKQHERYPILRVGQRREFLEVATEGLVALDEGGHVVAANQRFVQSMGRNAERLHGQHIEDLFGVRMDALMSSARDGTEAMALRMLHSGNQCFGLLRRPSQAALARRGASPPPMVTTHGAAAIVTLAGGDARMEANVRQALRVLDKGLPVLLHGESGTGKELFAQAMHKASRRAGQAFVALNCAAIPDALIESELFGYKDGAFTGARAKGARGKIAQAHGGTLFLDEIGDMPLAMQTRLLRVLAEREVVPLGAEQAQPVDLQVICATHRDLRDLVAAGQFRLDLYYRLNGLVLSLPALRERHDKAALIQAILHHEAAAADEPVPGVTEAAMAALIRHDWPGNIRQLKNSLRAAMALSEPGSPIDLEHLPAEVVGGAAVALAGPGLPARGMGEGAVSPEGLAAPATGPREEMLCALREHRWNVTQAARSLGVCRATLYRRMEKHGIVSPNRQD